MAVLLVIGAQNNGWQSSGGADGGGGIVQVDGVLLVEGNKAAYHSSIVMWMNGTKLLGNGSLHIEKTTRPLLLLHSSQTHTFRQKTTAPC